VLSLQKLGICYVCYGHELCLNYSLKPRTHDKQMLANMCLPTVLANKRQTVRCDWLAVVNIMTQNGRMHLALTTLIILLHFTSTLSTTAREQISGAYVFAYKQLNKSLLQQRRLRLLSPPSPPYCCPTKCCRV